MDLEYDIVAVGGGTAGLVTAAGAAYLGARAALVERDRLGGDCLWTGCVPSKALLASAKRAHGVADAARFGLPHADGNPDSGAVMRGVRDARAVVAHHDDPERFRAMGVAVHHGQARFIGANLLEVEGVGRIRSKRFVIATGAQAAIPPIPGLLDAGFLTNADIFELATLPQRLLVLGGGPIGLELAQAHRRLGADVTLLEMQDRILPKDDPDVAELLRQSLVAEGIEITTGSAVEGIECEGASKVAVTKDGRRFAGDEILVATGRRPNTADLDLPSAGVELDRAAVRVDARLSTTRKGIWAAGDVVGGLQFTHVADYMAKVVIQNALTPFKTRARYDNVPWVTYTDPEVAHVGMSEAEASAAGGTSYTYPFSDLDRSIAERDTTGFVRISADRKGNILGATVVGSAAGELLLPLVLARGQGLRLAALSNTIFPYPTRMEALKRAADSAKRAQLDTWKGALLRKVVQWWT